MSDIRLIEKDDIASIKYHKLDWDVVVKGVTYQIIRVEGFVHTIGGRLDYGDGNNFWAYPLNETLNYENLIEFNGCPGARWGIEFSPVNYIKTKWDETEILQGRKLIITRNDLPFYDGFITFNEAIAYIKDGILDEHPLRLNERDFDKKCIGRKVWWRSEPGIITRYIDKQACVIIEPDGIDTFTVPPEFAHEGKDYYCDGDVKTSIFDDHIWWFRD